MNRPAAFLFLLLLLSPVTSLHAQEDHGDETPPVPPEQFPAAYKDDQILPTSVSPDGRYGLIYPKYELSAEREPRLLLAALKPFHVLVEISHDSYLQHGHNSYSVSWTKDSSAVLVSAQGKWGPDKVLLVPIHDGQAGRVTDLAAEVKKLVRPDYEKAKARRNGEASVDRFNDNSDFIFESDYERLGSQKIAHETWLADDPEKITIVCFCTNNPKIPDTHTWTVRFDGTWDIAGAKFTQRKVTRLPVDPGKNAANH